MLEELGSFSERPRRNAPSNQMLLLDTFPESCQEHEPKKTAVIQDFSQPELLQLEKEYLGVYLSGHPLDDWRERFQQNEINPIINLEEEVDGKEVLLGGVVIGWRVITTKAGSTMASFKLEDLTGTVEVIVFPKLYVTAKDGYGPDRVIVLKGRLERQDEGLKILASQIRWLKE